MRLARVLRSITSTDKHPAYANRRLLLVQRVTAEGAKLGFPTVAVDNTGAGAGDLILLGAAPGLASKALDYPNAPVQQIAMGIVDRVEATR